MQTPQEYLKNRLKTCGQCTLTPKDVQVIKQDGLKTFLFAQITRKKFRKWKVGEAAKERILRVLEYCIANQEPIIFRFRFGGYKLWRLDSAPEVDWAEFFTFAYYSEYLAPIIAAHKPGAKVMFTSDDVFVERLDNIPKEDTEKYYASFTALAAEFKKYAPENFSIEMFKHSSLFAAPSELEKEFDAKMKEIAPIWEHETPPEKKAAALATSELNITWDGIQDLTTLTDIEKKNKILQSAIMHDALVQMPTIRSFAENNPALIYIFTTPLSDKVIALGTTKTSAAKFWVGTGVLEERDGQYFDRILTPSQIKKMNQAPKNSIPLALIPGKNFASIDLYHSLFDFS